MYFMNSNTSHKESKMSNDRKERARERYHEKVMGFVSRMRRIPRKAQRCELYGTVKAVVDERRAKNIIRKMFPRVERGTLYEAMWAMQEALDEAARP